MEVSGSRCEEKLSAWVGTRDGDGQVGESLTGWKVGEKRLQDEDGDGRLPDCRERICTVGCCFASIMQITCTHCAMFSWFCCFGGGRLAALHAAAAATIKGSHVLPRALLTPSAVSTQTQMQMNRATSMSADLKKTPSTQKRTLKWEGEIALFL